METGLKNRPHFTLFNGKTKGLCVSVTDKAEQLTA